MALTDISIKNAKPRERDYKLADGGGLYLLVTVSGGKLWRLKFRIDGIERKLSLGKYPALGLGDARKARDAAKAKIADGSDPAAAKRRERIVAKLSAATTFDAVANFIIALFNHCEEIDIDLTLPFLIVTGKPAGTGR